VPGIVVCVGGIVGFVYISFFVALFAASIGLLIDVSKPDTA
jgi:hypothetical protein